MIFGCRKITAFIFLNLFLISFFCSDSFTLDSFAPDSFAFAPEDHLSEDQEKRAHALFLQVKCPICAGQVIESSDTEIARELRKIIRKKIVEGKSDEQIKNYLVEKFGSDIIISPTFNHITFLLWFLPLIVVVLGGMLIFKFIKK